VVISTCWRVCADAAEQTWFACQRQAALSMSPAAELMCVLGMTPLLDAYRQLTYRVHVRTAHLLHRVGDRQGVATPAA
jgi:hypothetical protein